MAVDRTSGADVYSCIDCSTVTASGSYDGSSFDCALGTNIGQPICGANAYPGSLLNSLSAFLSVSQRHPVHSTCANVQLGTLRHKMARASYVPMSSPLKEAPVARATRNSLQRARRIRHARVGITHDLMRVRNCASATRTRL